jgi:uncharacterized protein involved in exopolysaccharide biosynthesis
MSDETEQTEEGGGSGFNVELVKSYLTFARQAIRAHRLLIGIVAVSGIVLTLLVAKYLPRTYSCTTVLMAVENAVLDGNGSSRPFVGAESMLMRRENIEQLIKDTGLVRKYEARRPPLMRAKDQVRAFLFGPQSDKIIEAILVGTLETRLMVGVKDDTLEIRVDWSDAATTAEVAKAAQDGFLRLRNRAETSAFQEKMAILDSHASNMRQEIDALAEQMKATLAAKTAELTKSTGAKTATKAADAPLVTTTTVSRPKPAAPDALLPELREKLAASKQRLGTLESERGGRINTERNTLNELKLRLTPNHPQVITQEQRLAAAQEVSSELALLRSEVSDMEVQIKQRDAMAKTGTLTPGRITVGSASAGASPTAEALPTDIMRLLEREDVDPALSAQMSGAVVRYASLRDEVRGAKLALDTAQAAFNHRYQVVIPVEEPNRASKPPIPVVVGAGIFISLLLAFAIPVLLELRRGVLVERWQVDHLQFPVLAELRLPERSE